MYTYNNHARERACVPCVCVCMCVTDCERQDWFLHTYMVLKCAYEYHSRTPSAQHTYAVYAVYAEPKRNHRRRRQWFKY